jgi:hypothetical protein
MKDDQIVRYLNALYVRTVVQECQIMSLRRILVKAKLLDDDALEQMISKCVDIQKELLTKTEDEKLAEILRSFDGPIQ